MPRANRHHIPGQVWHITHRCHKDDFLLKFAKDRQTWIEVSLVRPGLVLGQGGIRRSR